MAVSRLKNITRIGVEQMGDLADSLADPSVLRLENLDTNVPPSNVALESTRRAIVDDNANSYLPFLGQNRLRESAARLVGKQCGQQYDWQTDCIVSAGGLSGILNVLLATLEPGDQVLMTDPTYVGLINRVRLAGGVPKYIDLQPGNDGWRLNRDALAKIDSSNIKAMLLMSPSMPTGAVFDEEDWEALTTFCREADCWLINNTAMERILYDGRAVIHPASYPDMRERTITVGSASKEYRMIGWRVGWIVGPAPIMADVARVSISNVVCQTGIAMDAVATAIDQGDDDIDKFSQELQARRDLILEQLSDFKIIPSHGGWSMLVDVSPMGIDGPTASKMLLDRGKIAATAMVNWGGPHCENYLRLVYSNESLDRLSDIGARFRHTFA